MLSLHTLNMVRKLRTKKCYTVLSLGFLQDLSSLVQRPFSSDGQRAAAAALDLGHSQQAELWRRIFAGDQKSEKKKNLPNRTNPQIYNPNSNYRYVQLLLSVNLELKSRSSMKAVFNHMLDPFSFQCLKKKKKKKKFNTVIKISPAFKQQICHTDQF